MAETLKLAIQGMHCGACVRRVTGALEKLLGVKVNSVEVGSASVDYDPQQVAPDAVAAAISKIGFEVVGNR